MDHPSLDIDSLLSILDNKNPKGEVNHVYSPKLNKGKTAVYRPKSHSVSTTERSVAAKIYFEHYFDRLFSGKSSAPSISSARARRRMQIEQEIQNLGLSDIEKTKIREEWLEREHLLTRISREKMSLEKFTPLKPLGKGAFGFVQLVREISSNQLYAMKILDKENMLKQNQESHVRAERDVLSDAASDDTNKYIVKLICTFQDPEYLYFVMEYLPGGDLLSLLYKFDVFPEEVARFYAVQMILAIEEVHKLGYIHRDVKPDNFLIDKNGNLKIADMGLATDFHWSHETQFYDIMRHEAYKNFKSNDSNDIKEEEETTDSTKILSREKKELEEYILSTKLCVDEARSLSTIIPSSNPFTYAKTEPSLPLTNHQEVHDENIQTENNTVSNLLFKPPPDHRILTWRARNRLEHPHTRAYSVVGTNNYISPEVLKGIPYDYSCDWWSLGIIIFEMLYGYPPFASKSRDGTRAKILQWDQWLQFPLYVTKKSKSSQGYDYAGEVSKEGQSLIRNLLCESSSRLGSVSTIEKNSSIFHQVSELKGSKEIERRLSSNFISEKQELTVALRIMLSGKDSHEIKSHQWFQSIDFDNIKDFPAPWIPEFTNDLDTRYFDDTMKNTELFVPRNAKHVESGNSVNAIQDKYKNTTNEIIHNETGENLDSNIMELRKKLAFVGFTFKAAAGVNAKLASANNQTP